jgi:sugar lactone lactonase YvrE
MRPLSLGAVETVGADLARPECVLTTLAGDILTADWRGGVAHIDPAGRQHLYLGTTADLADGLRPNGIALEPDGSFLFAQLGAEQGGVWRLTRSGQVRPVLTEVDGQPLPPTNFCVRDALGRLWVTISTRLKPRALDYRLDAATGFIVLADARGARIVADGLGFTNECLVDPSGRWLYVNETYGRRFSRLPLMPDGGLGRKQVVTELGPGQYPDGFAFDAEGHAWITSIISNQLIRVDPATGRQQVLLEDADPDYVARVEAALVERRLGRAELDARLSTRLKNISSIAFAGRDLAIAYLGCLNGDRIYRLAMPVAGHPPPHWHYRLAD